MSHKKLIVGNWKMNPQTIAEAKAIAKKSRAIAANLVHTDVVMCPPAVFIPAIVQRKNAKKEAKKDAGGHAHVGAQDVSFEDSGPHTGEIGVAMLREIGVEYVIIGHSERRTAGETDNTVSKKVTAVLSGGLTPIVCVGEKSRDESGAHYDFLREQIKNSFAGVPAKLARDIVIAYEPVWAIGAKEPMKPEDVLEMSLFVKKAFADVFGPEAGVKTTVLYGGSVNFRNASDIVSIGKVDGLLVGRESVNVTGFVELLKAVDAII